VTTPATVEVSPAVGVNGIVVFGSNDRYEYGVNPDGQVLSRDSGQGRLWTAAAVDARGDVYFASRTGHVYGFDGAGHRRFDVAAGDHFDSYPALAPDGTLLVGDDNGTLFALR